MDCLIPDLTLLHSIAFADFFQTTSLSKIVEKSSEHSGYSDIANPHFLKASIQHNFEKGSWDLSPLKWATYALT